ncbi:hypothetical protein CPB85DRAFT_1438500 [Mucidula mucida]|nr:hypothetical protein CPB85DRAFT_1438500 [Mucidula mucida]
MRDLHEVMELNQRAIVLSPDDLSRFGGLCNMAQSLLVAWDYDGEMTHLQSAIAILREAVGIGEFLANPLDYALALNALSEAIQSQLLLSEEDIDECVSLDTRALTCVPKGHRERPLALAALATAILVRYTTSFQNNDFTLYHSLHEELRSTLDAGFQDPDILADYWALAQNIGPYQSHRYALMSVFRQRTYIVRAEYQPEQNDITISIVARSLAPGVFLRRLIDPTGRSDLLSSLQAATSDENRKSIRGRIAWLCRGKGIQHSTSFKLPLSGRIEAIEEEWLALMPVQDSHPMASSFYLNFSTFLVNLVEEHGLEALQWAQKYALRAWDVHQSHVPWGYKILSHIALLYLMQAEAECELSENVTPVMEAVDKAIYCLELASSETCPPTRLYEEVQLYLVDTYIMKHRLMSCDSPYLSSAIEILHHARRRNTFEHSELSKALETAADYCFTVGAHESALRVLEKGRGMLWARLVQLQAHTLKGTNKSVNDVAQLKLILEAAAEERGKVVERGDMPLKRTLNLSSRQRRLDMDIRRLMGRVQDQPQGQVEDVRPFMSYCPFRRFSRRRLHIPLPDCDRETLDQLVEKTRNALKDEGLLRRSLRSPVRLDRSWDAPQTTFEDILPDTWTVIVEPIMRALQIKVRASFLVEREVKPSLAILLST